MNVLPVPQLALNQTRLFHALQSMSTSASQSVKMISSLVCLVLWKIALVGPHPCFKIDWAQVDAPTVDFLTLRLVQMIDQVDRHRHWKNVFLSLRVQTIELRALLTLKTVRFAQQHSLHLFLIVFLALALLMTATLCWQNLLDLWLATMTVSFDPMNEADPQSRTVLVLLFHPPASAMLPLAHTTLLLVQPP